MSKQQKNNNRHIYLFNKPFLSQFSSRYYVLSMVITATLILMTLYQIIKRYFFANISLLTSNITTIIFTTIAAAITVHFIINKIIKYYQQIEHVHNKLLNDLSQNKIQLQKKIIQNQQLVKQIEVCQSERNFILGELHHRVRNNLQIISSFLKIQSNNIMDEKCYQILRTSDNRVLTIASVYDHLYQTDNLTAIHMRTLISDLLKDLSVSYQVNPKTIQITQNLGHILLDIDTAIVCALIINELFSNSLKYAFPDQYGKIAIVFHNKHQDFFELIISDNGIGIVQDLDINNMKTLGLPMVFDLVQKRLKGTIRLINDSGVRFIIIFKKSR